MASGKQLPGLMCPALPFEHPSPGATRIDNRDVMAVALQITSGDHACKTLNGSIVCLSVCLSVSLQTMQAVNKKMDPQKTLKTMQDFQKENMKMGMTEEMSKDTCTRIHTHARTRTRTQTHTHTHTHTAADRIFQKSAATVNCNSQFIGLCSLTCDSPLPRPPPPPPFPSTVNDTLDEIFDESGDEEESQDIVNQVLDEIGIEISGKVRKRPIRSHCGLDKQEATLPSLNTLESFTLIKRVGRHFYPSITGYPRR